MKLADFGISRVLNDDETRVATFVNGHSRLILTEVFKTIYKTKTGFSYGQVSPLKDFPKLFIGPITRILAGRLVLREETSGGSSVLLAGKRTLLQGKRHITRAFLSRSTIQVIS